MPFPTAYMMPTTDPQNHSVANTLPRFGSSRPRLLQGSLPVPLPAASVEGGGRQGSRGWARHGRRLALPPLPLQLMVPVVGYGGEAQRKETALLWPSDGSASAAALPWI
ncbi:hypothetical protein E2562_007828 [Oryza meyeriana var. granulata]|uniref:Uncharacterized protein n=1 Tax=Oryza meyeriana var. granulata TaxID=110450 RepID=A0A6G1F572_9ORYZ|nr:hypothetical protein E2562_007828 [Oryza meyeriana var. granulata]